MFPRVRTVALLERRRRLLAENTEALREVSVPYAIEYRFGFFNPVADQVVIRPRHRSGRAVTNPKANETRKDVWQGRFLVACDPGSTGL
jgi:hypothetical protein